jgi:hypothetical protein
LQKKNQPKPRIPSMPLLEKWNVSKYKPDSRSIEMPFGIGTDDLMLEFFKNIVNYLGTAQL